MKRISLIVLSIVLLLCLCACGKRIQKPETVAIDTTAEQIATPLENMESKQAENDLSDHEVPTEEWKSAFAKYFKEIEKKHEFEAMDAYIVDLDGDEIPEVVGGWKGSWMPIIAYYEQGTINELDIPLEWSASSVYAGTSPNRLYFDLQNCVVVVRCEGNTMGTMYGRNAVAYQYRNGVLTECKRVKLDLEMDSFENPYSQEAGKAVVDRFEQQFSEFSEEYDLIEFGKVAVYNDDFYNYISTFFDFSFENNADNNPER